MAAVERGDAVMPDLSGLSEEERDKVMAVMLKAKEFEAMEEQKLMRQPLEGLLYKYTNVVNGWQYRWFALEPEAGRLEYYQREEQKRTGRPRGAVYLAGAVISPSDEDSQTFNVNAANGEIYRLRAQDARERQHWVNRLRATAEYHTDNIAQMDFEQHHQGDSNIRRQDRLTYRDYDMGSHQQRSHENRDRSPVDSKQARFPMKDEMGRSDSFLRDRRERKPFIDMETSSIDPVPGPSTEMSYSQNFVMNQQAVREDHDKQPPVKSYKERVVLALQAAGLLPPDGSQHELLSFTSCGIAFPLCDMVKSNIHETWRRMVGLKNLEDWNPYLDLPPPNPVKHGAPVAKPSVNNSDYAFQHNQFLCAKPLQAEIKVENFAPVRVTVKRLEDWEKAVSGSLGIVNMMSIFSTSISKDLQAIWDCLGSVPKNTLPPDVVNLLEERHKILADDQSRTRALQHLTSMLSWLLADNISVKRQHVLGFADLDSSVKDILRMQPFGGPLLFNGRSSNWLNTQEHQRPQSKRSLRRRKKNMGSKWSEPEWAIPEWSASEQHKKVPEATATRSYSPEPSTSSGISGSANLSQAHHSESHDDYQKPYEKKPLIEPTYGKPDQTYDRLHYLKLYERKHSPEHKYGLPDQTDRYEKPHERKPSSERSYGQPDLSNRGSHFEKPYERKHSYGQPDHREMDDHLERPFRRKLSSEHIHRQHGQTGRSDNFDKPYERKPSSERMYGQPDQRDRYDHHEKPYDRRRSSKQRYGQPDQMDRSDRRDHHEKPYERKLSSGHWHGRPVYK